MRQRGARGRIAQRGVDKVFRCFGDATLGFAPALTYTEAEFDQLFARLTRTLDDVLAEAEVRAALA